MPNLMAKPTDPHREDETVPANEATPLLGAPEVSAQNEAIADEDVPDEEKPMPYLQIMLLCWAAIAEPVAYFCIFPIINEMIYRTGNIKESDVGFWSGLIESLFSLVQMILMIFYGRAADRLGRKPVLVFSLAGVTLATALFGMSQTLWQMIAARCLAGVFGGSVVTIRVMLSENCTKATQARAFSWYMFTRNLGIFIGPVIGGALADPAKHYPGTFKAQFFKDHPYALALFVSAAVCLSATLTSLVFLKETLKRKPNGEAITEAPMSTWEVLKSPGVPVVVYIFGHVMLLGLAYTAVSPVVQFTSVKNGGWGFSEPQIAMTIAAGGISQALWMLLVFPPLQRRIGTIGVLRMAGAMWPCLMAAFPILNEFLRHGWTTAFWVVGPPAIIFGSGVAMAFAAVQLAINDISPSPTVLATVNALALTVNSGVRAFAPVAFTSLFAVGVRLQWADCHLVWFVIVSLAIAVNFTWRFIPERARGLPKKNES